MNDTHDKQTVGVDLAECDTGGKMVVIVLEGKEQCKIQDGESGTSQTSFNRNTNELGKERCSRSETSLGLVQIVDHTSGKDHITQSGSAEPDLKRKEWFLSETESQRYRPAYNSCLVRTGLHCRDRQLVSDMDKRESYPERTLR